MARGVETGADRCDPSVHHVAGGDHVGACVGVDGGGPGEAGERRIVVDLPDVRGREGILKVHTRNTPAAEDVDLHKVAQASPGLSGADLENLVNEGILVQLAAGSLTGLHGNNAQNAAEFFLQRGLAHVVASEMHNIVEPRSPTLSEAYAMVTDAFDEQEAVNLFETNPNLILEGRSPQREPVLTPPISRIWTRASRSKINKLAPQRILNNWRLRLRAIKQRTGRESTG